MPDKQVINIIIAGLGGQGVITASGILADAAFRAGLDVKKSEIHGMSQRGGSVASDVRIGESVLSPMVPPGEADFLVVLSSDQVEPNRHQLKSGGVLITPEMVDESALQNKRSLNVALLGILSAHLPMIPETHWLESLKASLPGKILEVNLQAFESARKMGKRQ